MESLPNTDAPQPLLRFDAVGKSFDTVRVLDSVTFDVVQGRTLGIVGENGAGKSTLMNILGGNLAPDLGRMRFAGAPYDPRSPADATRAGIAFVHQELNLFPNLSIAENLFLTAFPTRQPLPLIDRGRLHRQAAELMDRVGLELPPETPVERLSAGERQLVELAGAIASRARLIILDEPTTSLSARETRRFFELLSRLHDDGLTLLFISHALADVLGHCDDIVVLRDGAVADSGPAPAFDIARLVRSMVGRDLAQVFPARNPPDDLGLSKNRPSPPAPLPSDGRGWRRGAAPGEGPLLGRSWIQPLLEVRHLRQPGIVDDVSFQLAPGEILGLAGLMGAGRSELARILFGLDPCREGEVLLDGRPLPPGPRRRRQAGIAFLTEDRRTDGLCLDASIAENLTLAELRRFARKPFGWLRHAGLREAVRTVRASVGITPSARDDQAARTLSGGNQQKVILGKWLLTKPRVLILDEPTRGIDVGAKFEIYQLIRQLADQGAGILVISSELEELIGLSDRILVMARGRLRDDIPRSDFSQERILRAALPA